MSLSRRAWPFTRPSGSVQRVERYYSDPGNGNSRTLAIAPAQG